METTFSRDGLTFDLHDDGPRDAPVVVLLHGFPGHHGTWADVAASLHAAGRRTLVPDQRGYSPGARPARRGAYRIAELARDVLAMLDSVGEPGQRVHLVGHDWGGFVAWHLGAVAPQRFDRLTIVSTPHPRALRQSLVSSTQALQSAYIGFFQLPLVPELALSRGMAPWLRASGLHAPVAERYAARMSDAGARTGALHWYRGAWLPGGSPMPRGDRGISVPTRYLWGRRDPALGRRAAELTERFVDAPYDFAEVDAGHWIPEHHPDLVVGAVLEDVAPGDVEPG